MVEQDLVDSEARGQGGRQAVGYLRGRGGRATVVAEEAKAEWREVFAELRRRVDALEASVMEAEGVMEGVARALNRAQPPMWRRVLVRWWRVQTGGVRAPVLVREVAGARGGVKLEQVGRGVKLRTDRGFGLCADLARRAVAGYWAVAGVRREMAEAVSDLLRVTGRAERAAARWGRVLGREADAMTEAHREAVARLRAVGYAVGEAEGAEDGVAGEV